MMRYVKQLVFGGMLVVILTGVVFYRSGKEKKPAATARILAEKAYKQAQSGHPDTTAQGHAFTAPEIVLKDADLYLFGSNKIKSCRIQAQESKVFPQTQITQCRVVLCNLTTNQNRIVTLMAPSAIINRQEKNIFFPGKVSGYFQGWHLEKHDAFYDSNDHTVKASNATLTSTKGISLAARKSILDLQNEIVYLQGDVVSSFEKR